MINENIAAISTPLGVGGVAVIRISGDSPLKIVKKMFKASSKIKPEDFEPYKLYTGEIDAGDFKDYGMCVYFKAPKSYTGENMVEFHCHGGLAITKGILARILNLGARLATNGEFTKRAFLNGKLSLSSAEGLIDMINSESVAGAKAGYYLYRENLKKQIEEEQDVLKNLLAKIDANIDFPEDGIEDYELEKIQKDLVGVLDRISRLKDTFVKARVYKDGVKVGIIGRPNTGKSSLLNSILSCDKAIVSDVAGTTRDVVEGSIIIDGVKFDFFDTAGIRESGDKIESVGIFKAKSVIESSDVLLFVLDASSPLTVEDREIFNSTKDKNRIVVYNKIDLSPKILTEGVDLLVSAKTGENVEDLKKLLYKRAVGTVNLNGGYITEERHFRALEAAASKLSDAIDNVMSLPLDLIAIDIKAGYDALGEITGKTASEDIINEIFSKFCVGK